MASTEKSTEKYLKSESEKLGAWCLKFKTPGYWGTPDRIVLWPGNRVYYAELKDRGKKLSPHQAAFHLRLRALGSVPLLIDTKEKVNQFLFHAIHAIPIPADSNLAYPTQQSSAVRKSRKTQRTVSCYEDSLLFLGGNKTLKSDEN